MYLIESVVGASTEFGWLRYLSPTNDYSPTEVLVGGSYDFVDALVLLVAFLALLAVSSAVFSRRDI